MQCDRLISLIKSWYVKVQEEAMAPARMVAFMEKHISQCEECLADPDVKQEVDKIREIVLPPSKALKTKTVRVPKEQTEVAKEVEEGETSEGEAGDEEKVNDSDAEEIENADADADADEDEDDELDPEEIENADADEDDELDSEEIENADEEDDELDPDIIVADDEI